MVFNDSRKRVQRQYSCEFFSGIFNIKYILLNTKESNKYKLFEVRFNMGEKSLKQLLADQKRKKEKVKKLETELRNEKLLVAKMDKSITVQKAAAAKKKAPSKKR
jgi:hypothetical protein